MNSETQNEVTFSQTLSTLLGTPSKEIESSEKGRIGRCRVWRSPMTLDTTLVTEVIGQGTVEIAQFLIDESHEIAVNYGRFDCFHHWLGVDKLTSGVVPVMGGWSKSLPKDIRDGGLRTAVISFSLSHSFYYNLVNTLALMTGFKDPKIVKSEEEFLSLLKGFLEQNSIINSLNQ